MSLARKVSLDRVAMMLLDVCAFTRFYNCFENFSYLVQVSNKKVQGVVSMSEG